ncbi:Pentatricopeptide repeat-containing protein 2, mitochondrial [Pseudolycoriella hygida]|uniref:Pentatricopeptide repeat-containing protein 2, mitochondrial n=1 Tax=Pseudolycoriella hygida TaxID=35572 RepID=A0A9Q0N418_9DIPT|nr:Pentatricopeptide repeat-containing protein 2, mitochondrial [Pseudolycoriella hygida]
MCTFQFGTHNIKSPYRSLYSLQTLGIDGYMEGREKTQQYFSRDAENFRQKMNSFIENEETSMIFTEDLKNMIHLAEPNDKDLQLVESMLRKFNKQSKEIRFGNFIFGPVVMRFFHHVNNPDLALKLFKDPQFDGFFDQLMTYQILVDMLYEAGRYNDVIEVFGIIRSRQIQGGIFPRHVVTLVFAACYKENTPESFKFMKQLWADLRLVGHTPMRRAVTFAAALALKQNAPDVAMEIVVTAKQQHYVTVRNIKVLAYTILGRVNDVMPILKAVLQFNDSVTQEKHTFCKDVIDKVKETMGKCGDKELQQNFNKIEKYLRENGLISENLFKDPQFDGFFDQLMTYQILVDMLYEAGRYNDVIEVFGIIRSRQIQGGIFPRHVVTLVFAACYKENTPESFKFMKQLWADLRLVGHTPMRRAVTFAAALALKQNAPDVAMEIVVTAKQQHYVTVRNIKVLAYTILGRVNDVMPILKAVLQFNDSVTQEKHTFCKDVIDKVKETMGKCGDKELQQNFNKIEKYLRENGLISENTLENLLTAPIDSFLGSQKEVGKDKRVLAASYNTNNKSGGYSNMRYGKSHFANRAGYERPGLEDLQ